MTVQCGLVLAGKYRLSSVLGRGGMGTVWRAEHLGLDAPVAIKIIHPTISSDEEAMRRCRREARAAAALRSPHVVQVLDFGRDEAADASFIAMELIEGESLAQRLGRVGRLDPSETVRIVNHVARALARAHEVGIVHRDLKPANVFLERNDDEETAKVLDFGTARIRERAGNLAESAPSTGIVVGTPYYMSPEHISGGAVDHRTDLWALGVLACECLVGHRPFDATDIGRLVLQICTLPAPIPSQLWAVPAGFDAWFRRATEREPARRFQSARALADELRRACGVDAGARLGSSALPAGPTTAELAPTGPVQAPAPASGRPRRRGRAALVFLAAGAALAIPALVGRERRPAPAADTRAASASPAPRPAAAPLDPAPPPRSTPIGFAGQAPLRAGHRAEVRRSPIRRGPRPAPAASDAEGAREAPPSVESVLDQRH